MSIDLLHIIFVGLLYLAAVPVLIYSYFHINTWRRPLYLLSIPIVGVLALLYGGAALQRLDGFEVPWNTGLLLRIVLFGVGLLFLLVSYVDRLEERTRLARLIIEGETTQKTDQLIHDQQLTMDEQHIVMDEQRDVMGDQRQSLQADEDRRDKDES